MRKRNRRSGFAMVEVMIVITVFMAVLASLFASVSAMHKRAVNYVSKEEADDIAVAAVRLMADEIIKGNGDEDSPAGLLETGMPAKKTDIVVTLEGEGEAFFLPVTVWSKRNRDELVLYGEAVWNGQKSTISLTLIRQEERLLATPSSAGNGKWKLGKYRKEEESGEQK